GFYEYSACAILAAIRGIAEGQRNFRNRLASFIKRYDLIQIKLDLLVLGGCAYSDLFQFADIQFAKFHFHFFLRALWPRDDSGGEQEKMSSPKFGGERKSR